MDASSFAYWWIAIAGVVGALAFRQVRRVYAGRPDVAALLLVLLLGVVISWEIALLALAAIVVLSLLRVFLRQVALRHG